MSDLPQPRRVRRGVPPGCTGGAAARLARGVAAVLGADGEGTGDPGGALPRTQKVLWNSYPL